MKATKAIIGKLQAQVQNSKLATKFLIKKPIAKINGSSVIIETIVQLASINSGIDMDWCYSCGRGYVFADGNIKRARQELMLLMPTSDLTSSDLL